MKVLVAPLNWGLGHASRCIPLIRHYLVQGDEVVLGGDGESLLLLRRHFPTLRVLPLGALRLMYSKRNSQVWAMVRALPKIVGFSVQDHRLLRRYEAEVKFDLVISDNRFGLWTSGTRCVYITHQLRIFLPQRWRWLEPLVRYLHRAVYRHYDEVWVPDREQDGLSGDLSHHLPSDTRVRYIGTLSRFEGCAEMHIDSRFSGYDVVAVLSGLEPQRTMMEERIIRRYARSAERVLIVQGKVGKAATCLSHANITIVPHLNDTDMAAALLSAKHIIARSGYSTIMDLHALGVLSRAELIPTPGQPEQEYLSQCIMKNEE